MYFSQLYNKSVVLVLNHRASNFCNDQIRYLVSHDTVTLKFQDRKKRKQ